jgi:hypothetical protein
MRDGVRGPYDQEIGVLATSDKHSRTLLTTALISPLGGRFVSLRVRRGRPASAGADMVEVVVVMDKDRNRRGFKVTRAFVTSASVLQITIQMFLTHGMHLRLPMTLFQFASRAESA